MFQHLKLELDWHVTSWRFEKELLVKCFCLYPGFRIDSDIRLNQMGSF